MLNVPPHHSKFYLIVIGSIYASLVTAIIVLASLANDWVFWIFASLTNIAIIIIGVVHFINLLKPKLVSSPLGKTLSYSSTSLENETKVEKTESNKDGKNK
jgi:hypothetical protein